MGGKADVGQKVESCQVGLDRDGTRLNNGFKHFLVAWHAFAHANMQLSIITGDSSLIGRLPPSSTENNLKYLPDLTAEKRVYKNKSVSIEDIMVEP
jgi:hypothetical protein